MNYVLYWKDNRRRHDKMKVINATTIGILISAHMEGDEEKFLSYANFIAEAYEEAGEKRSARIIRKRIDGSYKNDPQICLDNGCKLDPLLVEPLSER